MLPLCVQHRLTLSGHRSATNAATNVVRVSLDAEICCAPSKSVHMPVSDAPFRSYALPNASTVVGRCRCTRRIFRAETVDLVSACSCRVATWRMRPTRPIETTSERAERFRETPCARHVPSALAHVPAMTLDVPPSASVCRLLAADGRRMRTPELGRRPAIYTAFSGNDRHRFSAFWLRSKCSICSYQLNI